MRGVRGVKPPLARAGGKGRERLSVPWVKPITKVWRSLGPPTPDTAVWGPPRMNQYGDMVVLGNERDVPLSLIWFLLTP